MSDERAELAVSAFERGMLFVIVVLSIMWAHDLGILPF